VAQMIHQKELGRQQKFSEITDSGETKDISIFRRKRYFRAVRTKKNGIQGFQQNLEK
jgi:hypothetical protein